MNFYLLGLIAAITTIFGLTYSQIAREKLYLQKFYDWSETAIKQKLQEYNLSRIRGRTNVEVIETPEIPVDSTEAQKLENVESSESIEEIQGIRLRAENSNIQISVDETFNPHRDDNVLAAINASLKKLSTAANSGRINGAQLYEILLQETMAHDRARNENRTSGSTVIIEIDERNDRPRMYFGESPMEYVPHQK